jgi:carbonic anhydrase
VRKNSPVLAEMERKGEIKIVGAMYDLSNGEVIFY